MILSALSKWRDHCEQEFGDIYTCRRKSSKLSRRYGESTKLSFGYGCWLHTASIPHEYRTCAVAKRVRTKRRRCMQRLRNPCIAIYADLYARRLAEKLTTVLAFRLSLSSFLYGYTYIYVYIYRFIYTLFSNSIHRLPVHCTVIVTHCKLVSPKLTPTINEVAGLRIFTTSLSCKASNNAGIFIGSIRLPLSMRRNTHSMKNNFD